jgi:signal transduction histidine kinase
MERLPSIIGRLLNEERREGKRSKTQRVELRDAAGMMRENQRLVTIGRLTGSIAHEINNPLESITNLLFLIDHEPGLSARVRDYLTMAQRELERVVQISKQTLNFYRDTASPVPIRLSELLDEVLVLYARRISDKRVKVIRRFGSEEPLVVFPGEIRQVFSNLIANAIEASAEHGKLYLRIRKSRFWGDPRIVGMRVTVADNGIGMSAEVSRRVGEAFFTTKGQGGTGLGLWVSHSIIERYGGNLFLKSSTGERHGTVFSILLPTNLRPQMVGGSVNPEPQGCRGKAREPASELAC